MRKSILAIAAVGLCFVPACVVNPSNHDAGDVAFVHQAVQTLLCRKPRSTLEVTVLADRVATYGRGEVVAGLMETPEYVDCWTQILMDHMQVQRSGEYGQIAACINEPGYVVEDPVPCTDNDPATVCVPCNDSDPAGSCVAKAGALATHIRDDRPRDLLDDLDADGVDDVWNMHDAIRAALLVDDLHIAWRPWIFAVAGRPQVDGGPTDAEVRDNFMATTFGVNAECISCHSTSYSTTEVYAGSSNTWDRTANLGFDLHGGLFRSTSNVVAGNDPTGKFTTKCSGCHGADGTTPPSGYPKPNVTRIPVLTRDAIVTQILLGSKDANGVQIMPAIDLDGDGVKGFGDPQDVALAEDLADYLYEQLGGHEDISAFTHGVQFADPLTADAAFAGKKGPFGMSDEACGFKWRHDTAETEPSVFPAGGDRQFWIGGSSTTTPDVGSIASALEDGLALVTSLGGQDQADDEVGPNVPLTADREASVAMLLAQNIVGRVLAEMSGNPATVQHGLPRTEAQANLLRSLTAFFAVSRNGHTELSLKTVLSLALTSELFNRRSPADPIMPTPNNGYGAYQLDMYFNPWAATDTWVPSATGDNLNGQGDVVARRSPDQLLWSLHHDLGWPAPKPYPDAASADFPTATWMRQIGRYESSRNVGSTVWQLDSLVMWENEIGLCTSPDGSSDFIDELVADAYGAMAVPTVKSISLGLKDRLLQEPFFDPGTHGLSGQNEETLVKSLFNTAMGAGSFNSAPPPAKAAQLETALRAYCGILLLSPDYLMRNIPTVKTTPSTAGVFTTCLPDEPCTQTELEDHYDCLLGRAGVINPAPVCP